MVWTIATSAQETSKDASTQLFERMCVNKCHPPERIVSQRRSRDQWNEVLEKMAKLGAQGTDEEWETVLDYLLRHYGRVNVNKVPASELVVVLDITSSDADAIVQYRQAHGTFKDYDALAQVPGIDVAKLEQHRDAISF